MQYIMRMYLLLKEPVKEWTKIKEEDNTFAELFKKFLIYLILINFIIRIITSLIIFREVDILFFKIFIDEIIEGCLILIYVLISATIINQISKLFRAEKNLSASLRLTTYCTYSFLITSLFRIIPIKGIGFISLIYLF